MRTDKITRVIVLKAAASEIQIVFRYANGWGKQFLKLDRTACAYGGSRAWFRCACNRRVATLFDAGGGFYCRCCLKLRYSTQLLTKSWRRIHRSQSIRIALGGSANLLDEFPARPRYMRRKRYEIMRERAMLAQAEGLATLDRSLDRRLRGSGRRIS